ncbi:MAG: SCO1664 family protein, partial [Ilumatobacteraceae bacterium]
MPTHELSRAGIPDPVAFLHDGDVEVEGRMPWSSNATFLVTVRCGEAEQRAIYKPVRGERPLWDFEPGLHRRELAAFVLSELLGIGVVPPTVVRDGPYGHGSLQWFVDADHREHYFTIYEHRPDVHDQLRAIAVLDLLANNTDRKSGHCLLDGDRVWAIDNGLCFAAQFKLRTVIWEFADEAIDEALLARVDALSAAVPRELEGLLDSDEAAALQHRASKLVIAGHFPADTSGHRYPWPLV